MKRYIYAFVILMVSVLTLTSMKPSVNPPLKPAESQVAGTWSLIDMPKLLDLPVDDSQASDESNDAEGSLREITDNLTKSPHSLSAADMCGEAPVRRLLTARASSDIYSAMPVCRSIVLRACSMLRESR